MAVASPGTWNFIIYQGSKWEKVVTYPDRDMTGGAFRMQLRRGADLVLELTEANSRISTAYSAPDTTITLTIDADDTAGITNGGRYDLEYLPASGEADVERILMGSFSLSEEVTVA
jgi:hypothetical protein